ncbi:MAG: electron transport complex subunit E [Paramuribaculum sp.]|nr:electron transport complex subunit E [Paramuribaculum sp.]
MKLGSIIYNGVVKENPTFVLLLGMCPTLGTTGSAMTGLSMGLATTGVLLCSNMTVSAIKPIVPPAVRIPVYIVLIATFVTALQMLLAAYLPSVNATLGIFIPLIVVNCILLGRAEAFASRNSVVASAADGVGIGIGFTVALTLIGAVREVLGTGRIFGAEVYPEEFGSLVFVLAPGAFIVLGFLMALYQKLFKFNHSPNQ